MKNTSKGKVIVVFVEERGRTPWDADWNIRPELSRVFADTDAGRAACREYIDLLSPERYNCEHRAIEVE